MNATSAYPFPEVSKTLQWSTRVKKIGKRLR